MKIEIEDDKQIELVDEQKDVVPVAAGADLVAIALGSGVTDVETLKALIEMKNGEEDRKAKREFDLHFAEMQAEFTPIKRNKKSDKGMYAPVDELQKQYNPIITKHGFSYTWDELEKEGGALDIVLTISGYGHSKTNHKLLPEYIPDKGGQSGKPIMNVLQAEGTRTTYGQRYTFKNGFGITESDTDTDGGMSYEDGVEYSTDIQAIRTVIPEQLPELFTMLWKKHATDKVAREIMGREKDKRKKELK